MLWYEDEVKQLDKAVSSIQDQPDLIFFGSSSIRMWQHLEDDFAQYKVLNLGFGGSTLEACVFFFDRLFKALALKHLVLYAGDNDLGDGKTPVEVAHFFAQFCALVGKRYEQLPLSFVSIKPSPARWNINDEIIATNLLIQQKCSEQPGLYFVDVYTKMLGSDGRPIRKLFNADGLHLSDDGYKLWTDILLTHISLNVRNSLMYTS